MRPKYKSSHNSIRWRQIDLIRGLNPYKINCKGRKQINRLIIWKQSNIKLSA